MLKLKKFLKLCSVYHRRRLQQKVSAHLKEKFNTTPDTLDAFPSQFLELLNLKETNKDKVIEYEKLCVSENFCWNNSDKSKRMYMTVLMRKILKDMMRTITIKKSLMKQ